MKTWSIWLARVWWCGGGGGWMGWVGWEGYLFYHVNREAPTYEIYTKVQTLTQKHDSLQREFSCHTQNTKKNHKNLLTMNFIFFQMLLCSTLSILFTLVTTEQLPMFYFSAASF